MSNMSKVRRKARSSGRNLAINANAKAYSERPTILTNSQLTISTNGLSNSYQPDKYSEGTRIIGRTLKKSVSFSDDEPDIGQSPEKKGVRNKTSDDTLDAEVENTLMSTDEKLLQEELKKIFEGSVSMGGNRTGQPLKGSSDPQWFMNPVHKNRLDFPMHQTATRPERSASPLNRTSGNIGAEIAAKAVAKERLDVSTPKMAGFAEEIQRRKLDREAEAYFPVTLGASFSIRASLTGPPPKSKTLSPPGKGLPSPGEPWRPISPSKKRPKSPTKDDIKADVDKMYLMSSVAPTIGSASVLLTTPFQHELARLRMERLRIEEEHLLEVKRIQELERIRGPVPKWYELKTPDFHYEAHKNTELMKTSDNWQDLMDYRDELMRASKEFQNTYLT